MLFEKIQLEPDERVLTTVRKHWFVIVAELFGIFLLILLPFFILLVLTFFPQPLNILNLHTREYMLLISFIIGLWLLLSILSGFRIWTHYYLDLWVITDRRIITVDQINFFNRNVSIFRLERLQDIEFTISGFLPTLLNFGTLSAQTAGQNENNFLGKNLPDPRSLQATIQRAMDERLQVIHN